MHVANDLARPVLLGFLGNFASPFPSHLMETQAMKKLSALALAGMMSVSSLSAHAADTTQTKTESTKPAAAKPASSPGWLVIEEDFFFPLRFEPIMSLDSIRYHYRRGEEIAAANQIDKAVSWLKLAEGHAMPITKEKLTSAFSELTTVAKDLRAGNVTDAAKMDAALARTAHALGEWHYYKAKESWGKDEAQDAGRDLAMAAQYMQHAANSAHYQFGPDTTKVTTTLYEHGKLKSEKVHYDHNTLGMHLQQIEKGLNDLAVALKK